MMLMANAMVTELAKTFAFLCYQVSVFESLCNLQTETLQKIRSQLLQDLHFGSGARMLVPINKDAGIHETCGN